MAKKNNKNLILCICGAVAAVIVIVVVIILSATEVINHPTLNDAYFVSDGSKLVLNMENDKTEEDEEYTPLKTHIVYFYSGENITGVKNYYEYADEATAKSAYETMKTLDEFKDADLSIDGKFVIYKSPEKDYTGLTTSETREQIEFLEVLQNLNIDEEE